MNVPLQETYEAPYRVIDRRQLQQLIKDEGIDNTRAAAGVALVSVMPYKAFRAGRIPGSINMPQGREDEFEDRFHRDKTIVLYSGSLTCDDSIRVARELDRRGFRHVLDYNGGLADWRARGGVVISGNV